PDHVAATGAQGHPHANLVDAASRIIGSYTVEPNRSKDQRKDAEERSEACDEPLLRELIGYLLPQSANRNDRQIGIHGSHGLAYTRHGQRGSRLGQNDNVAQEKRAEIATRIFGLRFG